MNQNEPNEPKKIILDKNMDPFDLVYISFLCPTKDPQIQWFKTGNINVALSSVGEQFVLGTDLFCS